MSSDPNKKSPRTIQCKDVLWGTFEQMAQELECSVDYLVNEAMKQYARQRGQVQRGRPDGTTMPPPATPPPPAATMRAQPPAQPRELSFGSPTGRGSIPPPPPAPRGMAPHAAGTTPPPRYVVTPSMEPPAPARSTPPMMRPRSPVSTFPPITGSNYSAAGFTLSILYQGEKFGVTKDRFVIGRGKQTSDLTLRDPNVSRQHAMVEYQNGVYFMVDMGSTNGVEYNGQRIARKQIAEGDVFRICDHDLRFTYR